MRILIDINHPAHVHLFKHAIQIWRERDYEVVITARDKDLTHKLLNELGLDFVPVSATSRGFFGYFKAILLSNFTVWRVARKFDPDLLIGTSFAVAHVAKLLRGKSIVFGEDDWASAKQFWRLVTPFADFIVTPDTILDKLGRNHIKYAGCQELAYLHPSRFQPDYTSINKLLSSKTPYTVVRFVAYQAFHDLDEAGLSSSEAKKIVNTLKNYGSVYVSSEIGSEDVFLSDESKVPPNMIHDLLAGAKLLVSDSQTMTIEAALLGIPSIRINSFVGRIPVIEELEEEYDLTYGFLPENISKAQEKLVTLLEKPEIRKDWKRKRDEYLKDKIELTSWIVDFTEQVS
jgi:hypothetical protein